jgi:hypothetical protein
VNQPAVWRRKRGATWLLDIEAFSGAPTGSEVTRAALKKALNENTPPGDSAAEALVFSILFVAAAGPQKAYWRLTATAAQTAALAPDFYITDVRIEAGGTVTYSADLVIDARERVTEPA